MKKVNNYLKEIGLGWLFKASVIVSIAMLIAGFLVPPMGIIDGTVLVAVGEVGLIVNIPVFFAFAHDKNLSVHADLDDKSVTVSSNPTD